MSLSERDYMRPQMAPHLRRRFLKTTTAKIVAVNVAFFVLQFFVENFFSPAAENWFFWRMVLSPAGVLNGFVWTFFTYSLFHAGGFHLLGNMLGLWFSGHLIERENGTARLLEIYIGGVILGGLFWTALAFLGGRNVPMLGASAGVFAVVTYALAKIFEQEIQVFIYFIIPVRLRAKWVLLLLAIVTLGGVFFSEIPAMTGWWRIAVSYSGIAHSAHFGGMFVGGAFFLFEKWRVKFPRFEREKMTPLRQTVDFRSSKNTVNFPEKNDTASVALRNEVDRILEKIHAHGIASLTATEHATLEHARTFFAR